MDGYQAKTIVTRRSLKYTYFVSSKGESTKEQPALLFLHGFPDSAHLWAAIVAHLADLPNKIIIPDCLGYAGTDKPVDTALYAYDGQSDDIADILEQEKSAFNVVIGHDWGSALAQRAYLHKRSLFCGVVLLNTAYMVPSDASFDLAAINKFTEETFGFPQFSYWDFFLSPDCSNLVNNHKEKMWQALHGDVDEWMKRLFCVPDAMRNFLTDGKDVPLKEYAKKDLWRDEFLKRYSTEDFGTSLQMYKATAYSIQQASDTELSKGDVTISDPLLYVYCSQDAVCMREMMIPAKEQGLVPHLKEVVVDCGHWSPMEKPGEISQHIRDFLIESYSKSHE